MTDTISPDTSLIPVLDLAPLLAGSPGAADVLGSELRRALEDVGFFFITGHGMDWSVVESIYDQAARLHAMEPEDLQDCGMDGDHGGYLGFGAGTSYASEIAGDVRTPNLNAAFFTHRGGYRLGNRFPDLAGFEEAVQDYIDKMLALADRLLPVLAAAVELPHDFFTPHFDDPSCTLRLSHYPMVDYGEHDWGLAAHTDSTILTFLPANDVPGLQIRPAGHDWIEPPPLAESYLVNSGDMLKRWTNGRFKSTAHRVRNTSDGDRYAMPFFWGARDDALIEALSTCVSSDNPARHEPITYGDYQRWFLNRNYAKVTGEVADPAVP